MAASNTLQPARLRAALSQTELARRAGISRQALSAIESGAYQPGVQVALKLARALGENVENLFGEAPEKILKADYPARGSRSSLRSGDRASLARVGGRLVAVPLPPPRLTLFPPSALVKRVHPKRRVEVESFRSSEEIDSTVVVAGCDPSLAIVVDYFARRGRPIGVLAAPASSHGALAAVAEGFAHVAGVHLHDPKTGAENQGAAQAAFRGRPFRRIRFARWEIGLAIRPAQSRIRGAADLARRGVRLVNRESGAGARAALDETLARQGIPSARIRGYHRLANGHLEVAAAIAGGEADAGVTIRFAAELHGLRFQAWREESYDLIIPENEFESASVRIFLEALNSAALAREISSLCGYDTRQMGNLCPFDAPDHKSDVRRKNAVRRSRIG